MRLKNKIIILTMLVCLISILFMTAVNYTVSIRELEKEANVKAQIEAGSIAKDVDKWLTIQKASLFQTIESMVINNNFEKGYIEYFLKKADERNPGNSYYGAFVDKFFFMGTGWIPDEGWDPTTREWYTGAMKIKDFHVGSPYIDSYTGKMVFSISKSFSSVAGRKGVISSDIHLDYLNNLISVISTEEESYAFLIDENGNIMTHFNPEYLPTTERVINIEDILNGELKKIVGKDDLKLRARKVKDYDGTDRYFYFANVEGSGWRVGIASSAANITGTLRSVIIYSLIGIVLVFIISILLASTISNSISKPIKTLNRLIEKISYFDLTNDESYESLIKDKSEVGEMAGYINQMRKNLNGVLNIASSSSTDLVVASETISRNTNESAFMIEEVCKATEELATGAVTQTEESNSGFVKLNSLSDGFKYVIRGCQVLEKHAEDTLKANKMNMEITNRLKLNKDNRDSSEFDNDLDKSIRAFEEISHSIDDQFKLIKLLMQTIDNANVYKEEAISSIESIVSIGEESLAATEEVSASMEEQTANMMELAGMSDKLKVVAVKLSKEIEKFKIE